MRYRDWRLSLIVALFVLMGGQAPTVYAFSDSPPGDGPPADPSSSSALAKAGGPGESADTANQTETSQDEAASSAKGEAVAPLAGKDSTLAEGAAIGQTGQNDAATEGAPEAEGDAVTEGAPEAEGDTVTEDAAQVEGEAAATDASEAEVAPEVEGDAPASESDQVGEDGTLATAGESVDDAGESGEDSASLPEGEGAEQPSDDEASESGAVAGEQTDEAQEGTASVSEGEVTVEETGEALEMGTRGTDAATEDHREHAFVKGWLTGVGDVNFVSDKHRFVIGFQMFPIEESAGGTLTNRTYYLGAVPRVSLHFGNLLMGFELPLAFQLFNTQVDSDDPDHVGGDGFANAGKFAGFQWDETSEFAQFINYIQYGHKEDDIYLNIGKVAAATVGHGTQIRRYNPNIDLDHYHVSAQLDKGFGYGGLEFYTNDIVSYNLNGVLAYVKPARFFFPDNLYAHSLSIGLSYMFDRRAPYLLARDPYDSENLVAGDYYMPKVEESQVASIFGIDTEVKVLKTRHVDVKGYVDYSRLTNTGGDGFSLGSLLRVNVGGNANDERLHAFRVRGEVGVYHARYSPGYFDMFYEIEKYQANMSNEGETIPKLRFLESQTGGYRPGARFEATYSLINGPGVSAAIQGSAGGRDSQFLLHVELPTGEHLRLLATYVRMNLGQGGPLFALDDPNSLLIGRAKLKVLPFLFVNGEISKMYRLKAATNGDDTASSVPMAGDPATFKNVLRWVLETEVGFEF